MSKVPFNEIVAGVLAVLVFVGTLLLLVLSRPIPDVLSAADLAVLTFYFSAHSFNAGVEAGIRQAGRLTP